MVRCKVSNKKNPKDERLTQLDAWGVHYPYPSHKIVVVGRDSKNNLYHIVHDAETGNILDERHMKYKSPYDLVVSGIFSIFGVGIPYLVYDLLPNQRRRRAFTKECNGLVELIKRENIKDLVEAVVACPLRSSTGTPVRFKKNLIQGSGGGYGEM